MGVTGPVRKYIEYGMLFGDSEIILLDQSPTLFKDKIYMCACLNIAIKI